MKRTFWQGRPWRRGAWLLFLSPALASCEDKLSPQLNPDPKHVVRIVGRMPASLEAELRARYAITRQDRACTPGLLPQWGAGTERGSRSETLAIKRSGDYYETDFVVDKYLPGKCGWRFDGVGASVVRNGNQHDIDVMSRPLIEGRAFYDPDYQSACIGLDRETCQRIGNSLDTPVVVPCMLSVRSVPLPPPAEPSDGASNLLCTSFEYHHKREHLLKPATKQVQIDFYDLETEALPSAAPPTRKGDAYERKDSRPTMDEAGL